MNKDYSCINKFPCSFSLVAYAQIFKALLLLGTTVLLSTFRKSANQQKANPNAQAVILILANMFTNILEFPVKFWQTVSCYFVRLFST